jgi:hypothetical protein
MKRILALLLLCLTPIAAQSRVGKTQNVILVMSDGLRWQEIFDGVDAELLAAANDKNNGSKLSNNPERVKIATSLYMRSTPGESRVALMPFLWSVVVSKGQIFGNRKLGSSVTVTNGFSFSYPGYNEILTGIADPKVNSNDKIPNANVTVFEWLHGKPSFTHRVAAFGAWDTFRYIFNQPRAGFPVNSGYKTFDELPANQTIAILNTLKRDHPPVWIEEPFDSIPFYTALEYMKDKKPRLLFIGLGETDEWAHDNSYPEYLNAIHRVDQYLKTVWETVQSIPAYRGRTTILFTADHGRGNGPNWVDHGEKIPESRELWLAAIGPDTEPLGERKDTEEIGANQIAATIAALLGEDYVTAIRKAARPIKDLLPRSTTTRARGAR